MATSNTPTVYIVDDNQVNLELMAEYLEGLGYAIQTFASSIEFVRSGQLSSPGCILLDNMMPDLSGIEVQEAITARKSQLPIVFISGDSSYADVFTATKSGAVAFLQKPVSLQKLQLVVANAVALSKQLSQKMASVATAQMLYDTLTERERDVFQLLVAGKPNKMIARKLDIALRTVEFHRANIQKKMQTTLLTDLIDIARRLEL